MWKHTHHPLHTHTYTCAITPTSARAHSATCRYVPPVISCFFYPPSYWLDVHSIFWGSHYFEGKSNVGIDQLGVVVRFQIHGKHTIHWWVVLEAKLNSSEVILLWERTWVRACMSACCNGCAFACFLVCSPALVHWNMHINTDTRKSITPTING